MKGRSAVVDIDLGWKDIQERFRLADKSFTNVGVIGPEAEGFHGDSAEGLNLAELAAIHEFGSMDGTIPERSFIRDGIDANIDRLNALKERVAKAVFERRGMDIRTGLGLIGAEAVRLIRNRMREGIPPPLAGSTLRRRQALGDENPRPLIDTGQLINAITHTETVNGEGGE